MPLIEIKFNELRNLVGEKLPKTKEDLEPLIFNIKGEIKSFENDILTLELADGNRPDLWTIEGIARELKGILGVERGLKEFVATQSDLKVFVSSKLEKIRPFIACAVIKNIKFTSEIIEQLMQAQSKIDTGYGRDRAKASVGFYNFDLVKFPLKYTTTKPHENAFIPLGFENKISPHEILKQHPKGQKYGNLIKSLEEYPIFIDSDNKILSLPPIINSADLGKVDENTKNVLIEVTGTDYETVNHILTIFATALAERGGKIFSVTVDYPYRNLDTTPHLENKTLKFNFEDISKYLGIKLLPDELIKFLQSKRYFVKIDTNDIVSIKIPCYRKDIMHYIDVIEDIAIAYELDNFESVSPEIPTAGKFDEMEKFAKKIKEICIGLGCQEILTFTLTNKENLFIKMGCPYEKIVEIANPVSLTYSVLRNKLAPSLLEFLSANTKKPFPQKIFEIGDVVIFDSKQENGTITEKRLCLAISHSQTNFTEIKQHLDALFTYLGITYELEEVEHNSFISGRCAEIILNKQKAGIIGEIHPMVLENWGLEQPIALFELRLPVVKNA